MFNSENTQSIMIQRKEMLIKIKVVNDLAKRSYDCVHQVDHFAEYRSRAWTRKCYAIEEFGPLSPDESVLLCAVRNGDTEEVHRLLEAGAPAGASNEFGTSALHLAGELGDIATAELLLAAGASPQARDIFGRPALLAAVRSGCAPVAEALLRRGCDPNQLVLAGNLRFASYLHIAVERNHVEIVELLLQSGIQVDLSDCFGRTALHRAVELGLLEIAELLLRHGADMRLKDANDNGALILAVEAGQEGACELLLRQGADVNQRGLNGIRPLHLAIRRSDNRLARRLLELGAEANATMRHGHSALHLAVNEQNWPGLELLLRHGADPNLPDHSGRASLYRVVEARQPEALEALLRHGAQVSARDVREAESALHLAVRQGWPAATRLLLEYGADVDARDRQLRTPLHLAVQLGQLEVFQLLSAADVNAADERGCTALHLAIDRLYCDQQQHLASHRHRFFEHLLSRGADVNRKIGSTGKTPLHLAVKNKCGQIVWDLLCRGAAVDARARLEETPLRMAVANRDADCIEDLLTFGARLDERSPILDQVLARFLLKRRAAGFALGTGRDQLLPEDGPDEEMKELRRRCDEEVARMKSSWLDEGLSYHKFLHGSKRQLAVYAGKDRVRRVFEGHLQRAEFPLYANMLERNFVMGKYCGSMLEKASDALDVICGHRLPSVPLDVVLDFLVERDMYNVIETIQ